MATSCGLAPVTQLPDPILSSRLLSDPRNICQSRYQIYAPLWPPPPMRSPASYFDVHDRDICHLFVCPGSNLGALWTEFLMRVVPMGLFAAKRLRRPRYFFPPDIPGKWVVDTRARLGQLDGPAPNFDPATSNPRVKCQWRTWSVMSSDSDQQGDSVPGSMSPCLFKAALLASPCFCASGVLPPLILRPRALLCFLHQCHMTS